MKKKPHCVTCHGDKNLHRNTQYSFICTACNTERARKYRATKRGKIVTTKARKKYYKKNIKRMRILEKNNRTRPEHLSCDECGTGKDVRLTVPNVDKPNLTVPLCAKHHYIKLCKEKS